MVRHLLQALQLGWGWFWPGPFDRGLSPTTGRVTPAAAWGGTVTVLVCRSDSVWVHKAPARNLHTYSCISAFEDQPGWGDG